MAEFNGPNTTSVGTPYRHGCSKRLPNISITLIPYLKYKTQFKLKTRSNVYSLKENVHWAPAFTGNSAEKSPKKKNPKKANAQDLGTSTASTSGGTRPEFDRGARVQIRTPPRTFHFISTFRRPLNSSFQNRAWRAGPPEGPPRVVRR